MKLCISQATTMASSFADDLSNFAEAGCLALEVWLTKLEKHLETHSADETRRQLTDQGFTLTAAAYQGGLLTSQGEARRVHFEHFRKRLELCQYFRIPTLLVWADFVEPTNPTTLERALVSLKQAAQWAAGADVRLGLEFRSSSKMCTNLPTALALVQACAEPNLGVCLDLFHYYTGPSKFEDLSQLTPETLAHVQLCDLSGTARESATDADRILPGEGDFLIQPVLQELRKIGYAGWVSLEVLNPTLWQVKPSQVIELGLGALKRVSGAV